MQIKVTLIIISLLIAITSMGTVTADRGIDPALTDPPLPEDPIVESHILETQLVPETINFHIKNTFITKQSDFSNLDSLKESNYNKDKSKEVTSEKKYLKIQCLHQVSYYYNISFKHIYKCTN